MIKMMFLDLSSTVFRVSIKVDDALKHEKARIWIIETSTSLSLFIGWIEPELAKVTIEHSTFLLLSHQHRCQGYGLAAIASLHIQVHAMMLVDDDQSPCHFPQPPRWNTSQDQQSWVSQALPTCLLQVCSAQAAPHHDTNFRDAACPRPYLSL